MDLVPDHAGSTPCYAMPYHPHTEQAVTAAPTRPFAVTSAMAMLLHRRPQQAVTLHAPSCSVDPELTIYSLPSLGGVELTSPCSRDVVRLSFPR